MQYYLLKIGLMGLISLCFVLYCPRPLAHMPQQPENTESRLLSQKSISQPLVYILHTPFLLTGKLDKLAHWAQVQQITVKWWTVTDSQPLPDDIKQSALIIIDATRSNDVATLRQQLAAFLQQTDIAWVERATQTNANQSAALFSGNLPLAVAELIGRYYQYGGEQNYHYLFDYLSRYLRDHQTEPLHLPQILAESGFYHPDAPQLFTTIDALMAWKATTTSATFANVIFTIHANMIADSELETLQYIAQQAKQRHIFPLFYWFPSQQKTVFMPLAQTYSIEAIVNMQHMQNLALRQAELTQLNIPILQTLSYRTGDSLIWANSLSGVTPASSAMLITLPESIGMSDPLVIAAVEDGNLRPIPRQIDALVDKLARVIKLKSLANQDKKLVLLFWNHPHGEKNIAASHLNVPASMVQIMHSLQQAGYQITPADEQTLIAQAQQMLLGYYDHTTLEALLANDLADTLPLSTYQAFLAQLPPSSLQQLKQIWGEPTQHWSYRPDNGGYFIIPRARYGHLVLMPQPPRAGSPEAHYHDTTMIPDHIYLIAYRYLQKQFGADALIHLGTHGTQEWLPGKDRGLDVHDFALLPLADLPVFYPYIQDNIGEAIQVKRRGRGVTISHQTPVFAPAGLYASLDDIHQLLHEYQQLDAGLAKAQLKHKIIDQVFNGSLNLAQDLGWQLQHAQVNYDLFLADLHDHLHRIASQAIPLGLHTFGQTSDTDLHVLTVFMQLGEAYYALFNTSSNELFAVDDLARLKQHPAYQTLYHYLQQGESVSSISDARLKQQIEQAQVFARQLTQMDEMSALLNGLAGGFIEPCPGGDPVRRPEIRNGCNLYGFEPQKLPTKNAYAAGQQAFDQLITDYQQQHQGAYPTKLAFSLWSSEAIRHNGVSESQILHALGLRPVWQQDGQIAQFEIIPTHELDHPRIDVVVQVTGVYRDQFDLFMKKLAQAIDRLAELNEPNNPIYQNSQQLAAQLSQPRYQLSADDARRYSHLRLFSPAMGSYGTQTSHLIQDSEHGQNESEIVEHYLTNMQYGYGANDKEEQVKLNGLNLYREQLKNVDVAILARSSNLNGLLSTDHPFEFLGGISLAVRHLSGKAPDLYIADLRQSQPRIVAANKFLATELRAQFFNPNWIQAMKKEGYAGTLEILDMANNLWGWQVTDNQMVREDQWTTLHQIFVNDAYQLELNQWYEKHNAAAQLQLVERLAEAIRKDHWHPDEQIKAELVARWQQLSAQVSLVDKSKITRTFIENMAQGFGLNAPASDVMAMPLVPPPAANITPPADSAAKLEDSVTTVKGPLLTENQPNKVDESKRDFMWIGLLFILVCSFAGATYQFKHYTRYPKS